MSLDAYDLDELIAQTRRLAARYRRATGKPLAVGAELARHDAARLLGLRLCEAGEAPGVDAIGTGEREGLRIQIKGRAIFDERKRGQRIGQVNPEGSWDRLVLVLMDENLEPFEIHEAPREAVLECVERARGSSRSRRGAISVARFRAIGRLAWSRELGAEGEEPWSNRPGADGGR